MLFCLPTPDLHLPMHWSPILTLPYSFPHPPVRRHEEDDRGGVWQRKTTAPPLSQGAGRRGGASMTLPWAKHLKSYLFRCVRVHGHAWGASRLFPILKPPVGRVRQNKVKAMTPRKGNKTWQNKTKQNIWFYQVPGLVCPCCRLPNTPAPNPII